MKIEIECTFDQATAIRDALHNYYHEAKPLRSARAVVLANSCKDAADQLSRRLMIANERTNIKIRI